MRFSVRILVPTVSLAMLVSASGCGELNTVAVHVDPPHWPSDFPDAVDRLLEAQQQARQELSAGRIDEARENQVPVLRDLAVWLPEVSADSDMPEEPWNRVNELSSQLVPIYERIVADLNAGKPVPLDRLASADPILDKLQRERDEADPAWFPAIPSGPGDSEREPEPNPDADNVPSEGIEQTLSETADASNS